jgi:hypothetical protein
MSEYAATEYEGTRPVPGEPGNAHDRPAKDKAMQSARAGRQPLRRSPACERRR